MENIIVGLITGLISGIISGFIVNEISKIREFDSHFRNDVQNYVRWMAKMSVCLNEAYYRSDYSTVLWLIEDEPIRETFNYLVDSDAEKAKEIRNYVDKIKWSILKNQKGITEDSIKRYKGKLYQFRMDAMKFHVKRVGTKLERTMKEDD